jgi:hypothetical protein
MARTLIEGLLRTSLCSIVAVIAGIFTPALAEQAASSESIAEIQAAVATQPNHRSGPPLQIAQNDARQPEYDAQQPQPLRPPPKEQGDDTFTMDEITGAGHRFFGSVSKGLAKVIEHTFSRAGRPNGYILGEEAGGAFVAGLRYGEGTLYTKDAGRHKVYWQGPSIGYDFGAEGSKTMILVYNLRDPNEIYQTFGGVDGSAYFIGGVGVTFQTRDHLTLAPIRSGVGLRLGANVGYLKYTRKPTWNPF